MAIPEARRIYDREAAIMFGPVEPVHSIEGRALIGASREIYRPASDDRMRRMRKA